MLRWLLRTARRSVVIVHHSAVDVECWLAELPSPAAVRPSRCPRCEAASSPAGARVVVVGAGTFVRQRRSPDSRLGGAGRTGIALRRFFCLACRRSFSVGPADVTAHRHYETSAIWAVLALWSVHRVSSAELRRQAVGPFRVGAHGDGRWRSVRRWAQALHRDSGATLPSLANAALRDWVAQHLLGLLCRFGPAPLSAEFDACVAAMRAALRWPGVAASWGRAPPAMFGACLQGAV